MKRELPKMRNDHECESVKHYGRHKIIISFLKRVKAAQNLKKKPPRPSPMMNRNDWKYIHKYIFRYSSSKMFFRRFFLLYIHHHARHLFPLHCLKSKLRSFLRVNKIWYNLPTIGNDGGPGILLISLTIRARRRL